MIIDHDHHFFHDQVIVLTISSLVYFAEKDGVKKWTFLESFWSKMILMTCGKINLQSLKDAQAEKASCQKLTNFLISPNRNVDVDVNVDHHVHLHVGHHVHLNVGHLSSWPPCRPLIWQAGVMSYAISATLSTSMLATRSTSMSATM